MCIDFWFAKFMKTSSSSSAFEQCSASGSQSGGVGGGCDVQKVLGVAPQLLLQRCSMGPLLPSGFSEEGA